MSDEEGGEEMRDPEVPLLSTQRKIGLGTCWYLDEEEERDFLTELRGCKIGDKLPSLKPAKGYVSMLPENDPVRSIMHEERREGFEDLLEEIGESGRNQLAMPVEYLAQVKLATERLKHMFSDSESPKFSMRILPEVELYYDPSYMVSSVVASIYMVFVGTKYPKESTWQKTFKIHQHMSTVTKVQHKIYFPTTKENREKVPCRYRLDMLLRVNPDEPPNDFSSNAKEIRERYGIPVEELNDFCFRQYDRNERLVESEYWKYLFGYVEENGSNHLVLSDGFDYSIGRPEVIKERALYGMGSNPNDIGNWFSGSASVWSDKKSNHPGLPHPHYALKKASLDEVATLPIFGESSSLPKPKSFADPIEEDLICKKDLMSLSILSSINSSTCYINGAWLFGSEQGLKGVLVSHVKDLNESGKLPFKMTGGAIDVATNFDPNITVWRVNLNMNTANYHYYHYKHTPPKHPFEKEIEEELLRQKRITGCLPPLTFGECFEKPEGYVPGSELPSLISEEDQREFDELGICMPFEIEPMPTKQISQVINELKNYYSDHWEIKSASSSKVKSEKENVPANLTADRPEYKPFYIAKPPPKPKGKLTDAPIHVGEDGQVKKGFYLALKKKPQKKLPDPVLPPGKKMFSLPKKTSSRASKVGRPPPKVPPTVVNAKFFEELSNVGPTDKPAVKTEFKPARTKSATTKRKKPIVAAVVKKPSTQPKIEIGAETEENFKKTPIPINSWFVVSNATKQKTTPK